MTDKGELAHHITDPSWLQTPEGAPRGYIQPEKLREVWFHTGTDCNMGCSFCLEAAAPGDCRLEPLTLVDVAPYVDEAVSLAVEQFGFTGGEPFVNPQLMDILRHALERRPCLVLTNGTDPAVARLAEVAALKALPNALSFRVSLDRPSPDEHDAVRGAGAFERALNTAGELHRMGFHVSIARHAKESENSEAAAAAYVPHFQRARLPEDTPIVVFPDLHRPCAYVETPAITENCMTTYKTAAERARFMCAYSKMVVKKDGRTRVYACTLVDDDPAYDMGGRLAGSMQYRVMLRHPRCYSCFAQGASCSEL